MDPSETAPMQDLAREIQRLVPGTPDRGAIEAPGREAMSYDALWVHTGELASFLSSRGIRRGDAVAIVMPDGPEQLTTLLAVSQVAVCAPLNPAFRPAEFEFSLGDLHARALIVQAGMDSAAVSVARGMGIEVFEVAPDEKGPAGALTFTSMGAEGRAEEPVYSAETALLLHTSATTGQPKLVPLTHAQIIAMVAVSRKAFPNADSGRVLMITPQFHLHCILSIFIQLFSGGSSICTAGFRPEDFFGWMRTFAPTQYTANPTLHRAILSLWQPGEADAVFRSLRFVTSAGAPMTRELQEELESRLGVPVLDGYGLTETGRVTLTPLDPSRRKPGSVGECVGPEVAILGRDGAFLGPGCEGEILVRGPMVTSGYAHHPEANRDAFLEGWFRTGDLGRLDADGFLFVTGRLKEMINRGAEKILPYEVEAVLARHPIVQEVAVFGFPHLRLGEDIAAAVVLRPGASRESQDLRRFAAEFLADFKVPRRILFVAEIPKGRTGKYQRARLAETLGLIGGIPEEPEPSNQELRDPLDAQVARIWAGLLKVPKVGGEDDFFALGGDSLLALTMLVSVQQACGCQLGTGLLAMSGNFGNFTAAIREAQRQGGIQPDGGTTVPGIVALKTGGRGQPLFLVNGVLGYRRLADYLGDIGPVYGMENRWCDGSPVPESIEAMAGQYVVDLRKVQPRGPYLLGGHSIGGLIAFEMARLLIARGESISGIILLDSDCFGWRSNPWVPRIWLQTRYLAATHLRIFAQLPLNHWYKHVREKLAARASRTPYERAIISVGSRFTPAPLAVPTLLLRCFGEDPARRNRLKRAWSDLVADKLIVRDVPGEHSTLLQDPHVSEVAAEVLRYLS